MHVVVAGVLVCNDRVLLTHRNPDRRWYPNVWDLPGGHVEHDESEPQALAREMHEELGVRVLEHEPSALARFYLADDQQEPGVRLSVWRIRTWQGVPRNQCPDEHDAVRWFAVSDLDTIFLAHHDYPLLLRSVLEEA